MLQPPFKTKGIYARKINPDKELTNYKPTKLGSIWKAAIGDKEEAFYEIIWFSEIYNFNDSSSEEKQYCADYSNMTGEIFGLSDFHKNRGSNCAEYKNVKFDEKRFEFGNETVLFSGSFVEDFLYLHIKNIITGESLSEKLRYVPWN